MSGPGSKRPPRLPVPPDTSSPANAHSGQPRPLEIIELDQRGGPSRSAVVRIEGMIGEALWELGSNPIGMTLNNRYQITGQLGQGGTSIVYKADDLQTGKPIAIKVTLPPENEGLDEATVFRLALRLQKEGELLEQLDHPYIVKVLDHGRGPDGRFFLVTEYLEGATLARPIREDGGVPPLPWDSRTRVIASQICDALAAMHAQGIIHRDLKPENIMVVQENPVEIRLFDLGIAKEAPVAPAPSPSGSPGRNTADPADPLAFSIHTAFSIAGQILGTARYAAPEQLSAGGEITPATDVYALGGILYHLLAGRPAFDSPNPLAALTAKLTQSPKHLREVNPSISIPAELETFIMSALDREPGQRPLLSALQAILNAQSPHAPPGRPAAADAATSAASVSPSARPAPIIPSASVASPPRRKIRRTRWIAAAAAGVGLLVAGGVGFRHLYLDSVKVTFNDLPRNGVLKANRSGKWVEVPISISGKPVISGKPGTEETFRVYVDKRYYDIRYRFGDEDGTISAKPK